MSMCDNLVKTFLFITNFLIFLLSCVVIALGIWVLVDKPSLINLLSQTDVSVPIYSSASIIFLIVASAAIIISFLGCCGAYKESRCMLGTYFLLVLSLLILITVATVIGLSQGIDSLITPLRDTVYIYDKSSTRVDVKEVTALWDTIQTDFKCCGVESARDWAEYNPRYTGSGYIEDAGSILMGIKVPASCCATATAKAKCQVNPSGKNGAYVAGCFVTLYDQISDHMNVVSGVVIAVIVIMALDLLIAFYMCTCSLAGSDGDSRPKKRLYVRPGNLDSRV